MVADCGKEFVRMTEKMVSNANKVTEKCNISIDWRQSTTAGSKEKDWSTPGKERQTFEFS